MEKGNNKEDSLPFYHIGRIVKVINKNNSSINLDKKSKAVIEMWDNNVVTCEINSNEIKDNKFVIVLFKGLIQNQGVFMRPSTVTDVLDDNVGEEIWNKYKSFLDKSKPTHPFTG